MVRSRWAAEPTWWRVCTAGQLDDTVPLSCAGVQTGIIWPMLCAERTCRAALGGDQTCALLPFVLCTECVGSGPLARPVQVSKFTDRGQVGEPQRGVHAGQCVHRAYTLQLELCLQAGGATPNGKLVAANRHACTRLRACCGPCLRGSRWSDRRAVQVTGHGQDLQP